MAEERTMLQRLFNWMAAMSVIYGRVTITGEDYPTQVVDFGRVAGLTRILAGTARWGEADAAPLKDIADLRTLAFKESGSVINRVTMGIEAFDRFFANEDVQKLLKGDQRVTTRDNVLRDTVLKALRFDIERAPFQPSLLGQGTFGQSLRLRAGDAFRHAALKEA